MSFAPPLPSAGNGNRSTGLLVVAGLHVLLGWALASGLGRDAFNLIKKPIEAVIVPEVVAPPPPPPPPPPPKVEKIRELPKLPPPPAYVPPPDNPPPQVQEAPTIQATQPELPPAVEPAPPAPTPAPAAPTKQEISVACPGYQTVLEQSLGDAFERVGIAGSVRTLITVRGNQIVDAVAQSGPKEYHRYVQSAIKRMKCAAGGAGEVQVVLEVVFKK